MTPAAKKPSKAGKGFSLISAEKLIELYATMANCRSAIGSAQSSLKSRRATGADLPPAGQEAAIVGAAIDLRQGDSLWTRWSDEFCKVINPSPLPVQGNSPSGLLAAHRESSISGTLTLAFVDARRTERTAWRNAFGVAVSRKLPIIFVKLNATESSSSLEHAGVSSLRTKGYFLPLVSVDGNDAVAVYRVASEAITHARKGHGPSVIESLCLHQDDPLDLMRNYLITKGLNPGPQR